MAEMNPNGKRGIAELRGKATVRGLGLFFVRSSHLLHGASLAAPFYLVWSLSCSWLWYRTVLIKCWTAISWRTSCQSSLAWAAAASLSDWSLAHSACQDFMGKGSWKPASFRLAR